MVSVLLVNPPSPPEFRVSRGLMGGFGMAVGRELLYPPIELAHVAAALEMDGHQVQILDADALDMDAESARKEILGRQAQVVILDTSSTSLESDLALARQVRGHGPECVALLGSQVTYAPDDIFAQGGVDVLVRGEPELSALALVTAVANGGDFEGQLGLSWLASDGSIKHEADRPKIKDLDELPIPARHLLDNDLYHFPGFSGSVTTVKSSRGCPFNCTFCGYTLAQGLRFRFRSPEHVLSEIDDLYQNHGLRHIVFRDPIFSTRKDRVQAICAGIIERGYHDLIWQCETAVKALDRATLEVMAKAGCKHISLGIESGNAKIQELHCGNKLNDLVHTQTVFDDCRELGIQTRAFCMIGFPEETAAMADETITLVNRLDPDQVQYCAVTAYPGTPLYKMLRDTRDFDFATMTGFQALEGNEHMTSEQIESKIREGYRSFYMRPKRLLREFSHPMRLVGKLGRYFTLFRRRA
ncbi:MAG: anaerobic magnesium-protoporphyrin IX monomethyl ester cyclase [Planctomycetota bacterium]|jgi:anaerobic magnesium-protoporphyrin IX monomethyl ester cyclase